ncbi:hypothetical protein [Phocaeicola plebeius]|jgi:hypothetical protein|uniref:hypothetical protein n=2 Tax=Phocaeicola plebeius TaxID=310297 RepID=UPI0011C35AE2
MCKTKIYILILLSSLSFYNPMGLISQTTSKLLFYIIFLYALFVAIKRKSYHNTTIYPKYPYLLILSGFITATFNAQLIHEQNILTSFIAILPYFFSYLSFYILFKFDIPKDKIRKIIFTFCFISMAIYIVNYLTLPNKLFGGEIEEIDTSRGLARIGVFSIELIVFMLFYSIAQWNSSKKKKYLYLIGLSIIFIFLSLTRQIIFLSLLFGLILYINKQSIYKKVIIAIMSLFIYLFILPQIPIYNNLVELSENQVEENKYGEENIRITAWKFYTYEYQENYLTAIFGNGVPSMGNSKWGNEFQKTIYFEYGGNGCFTSDVGWAGFYWNYGLFATIGLISLLLKAIFYKKRYNEEYLTYWCVFIFLTSFASGPIIIGKQIISIMTVLYLIFGRRRNTIGIKKTFNSHEQNNN